MFNLYKNIRILDASRILVGPYATMMLSDLGAEVVKVEPFEGDETRQWGPPFVEKNGSSISTYFLSLNRGKKSICINLKDSKGQEIFHELAKNSDIIVENFNLGVTERLNIDYKTIKKINPQIIYASINGFGSRGPLSTHSGFDYIIQAASGLMDLTGEINGPPTKIGIALTDILTAMQASSGIQAALYQKQLNGQGCHIQTSLFESALSSLVNVGSNYLNANFEQTRMGNMHPSIVPYGVYSCNQSHIMIGAAQNSQFTSLCEIINQQQLAHDDLYKSNKDRVKNRDQLKQILEEEFQKWDADALCQKLNECKVPASKIQTVAQGLSSQQTLELQMIQQGYSDKYGAIKLLRSPLSFNDEIQNGFDAPPMLNEHRDIILQSILKMDYDEIETLIKTGVLKK